LLDPSSVLRLNILFALNSQKRRGTIKTNAMTEGVQVMKKNLPDVEIIEVENVPESADAERVKAEGVWPLTNLGKMDWLVEGVIGQTK
jgi:hypothetical protein